MKFGSGSCENGGLFQVVAMQKLLETGLVHQPRFGERQRLATMRPKRWRSVLL